MSKPTDIKSSSGATAESPVPQMATTLVILAVLRDHATPALLSSAEVKHLWKTHKSIPDTVKRLVSADQFSVVAGNDGKYMGGQSATLADAYDRFQEMSKMMPNLYPNIPIYLLLLLKTPRMNRLVSLELFSLSKCLYRPGEHAYTFTSPPVKSSIPLDSVLIPIERRCHCRVSTSCETCPEDAKDTIPAVCPLHKRESDMNRSCGDCHSKLGMKGSTLSPSATADASVTAASVTAASVATGSTMIASVTATSVTAVSPFTPAL